jgi:hypothetical protein
MLLPYQRDMRHASALHRSVLLVSSTLPASPLTLVRTAPRTHHPSHAYPLFGSEEASSMLTLMVIIVSVRYSDPTVFLIFNPFCE